MTTQIISNEDELVNQLVELAQTYDYLEKKNGEYLKYVADNQPPVDDKQDILRTKWRNRVKTYRDKHREEYNAYMLPLSTDYYQRNKERLNKQRNINYHKKKERDRLKDLEESQKIDSENK